MRKLVLVLVAFVVVVAGAIGACRVGPPPAIVIEAGAKAIGRKTPLTVTVTEPKRGLERVKIELVQGDKTFTLGEAAHQPAAWWSPWRSGVPSARFALEVGRDKIKELRQGEATIRVTAGRARGLMRSPSR